MFTFESTVRFSETDYEGKLNLPGIINYFQDCSEFHSQSLHNGAEEMTSAGHCWIMSAWQIIVNRYPNRNESIVIGTAPNKFKSIEGYRNFVIQDTKGNHLVVANSIWTFYDLQKQRPTRITEDQYEAYQLEPALEMDYAPRKIDIKEISDFKVVHTLTVQPSQLDIFQHMNNGQYVTIACDYMPKDYTFSQVRVEYKRPALLGDTIIVKQAPSDERCVLCLCNESDDIYAVVEFS